MSRQEIIKIFGDRKIRSVWDDEAEIWYFSIVDVVAVLTESKDPLAYWRKLKQRLKAEGKETVTNCHGLKLRAADGKMRMTDVATAEQMFRVIQSIPSPKAEPFKMWMAKVAAERIDQMQDPELSIQQALADCRRLGYTEKFTVSGKAMRLSHRSRRARRGFTRSGSAMRQSWRSEQRMGAAHGTRADMIYYAPKQ